MKNNFNTDTTLTDYLDKDIIKTALERFGKKQLLITIEELSELTKEIIKNERGFDNRVDIIEELADTYIVLNYLIQEYDISFQEINEKMYLFSYLII